MDEYIQHMYLCNICIMCITCRGIYREGEGVQPRKDLNSQGANLENDWEEDFNIKPCREEG